MFELIFVDRESGRVIWATHAKGFMITENEVIFPVRHTPTKVPFFANEDLEIKRVEA